MPEHRLLSGPVSVRVRPGHLAFALLALACAHAGPRQLAARPPAQLRLLTFSDLHGQLVPGRSFGGRPVGSAGVLAAWLRAARADGAGRTVIVSAGDLVGASPPASALLQDEPSVSWLNLLAGPACRHAGLDPHPALAIAPAEAAPRFASWLDPTCDVVGVIGNHELDEGQAELLRLFGGGDHPRGPFLDAPWRGARWPVLAANAVDRATGEPILPPYVVKELDGVRVGFIGVVDRDAGDRVSPAGIAGLELRDEAETVNRYVAELKGRGVRAIVVVLHQGGEQPPYFGWTREGAAASTAVEGPVVGVVARLDPEVDLVIAGHTHRFLDARLPSADGRKQVLVVQAFSAGMAYGDVQLEIDRASGDVVSSRARVQVAWADEGPGRTPDRAAAALQREVERKVAPMVERRVTTLAVALRRDADGAGESTLGDLVADAQRAAVPGAQVAFTHPGGLRADLAAGPVTWGDLFAAQPFGNELVSLTLTGAELLALLERQWRGAGEGQVLQVSGLAYAWSASAPVGRRVRDAYVGGAPLDPQASYRVVVNGYLADGGDGFGILARGADRAAAGADLDALVTYLSSLPQPVGSPAGGRIRALP